MKMAGGGLMRKFTNTFLITLTNIFTNTLTLYQHIILDSKLQIVYYEFTQPAPNFQNLIIESEIWYQRGSPFCAMEAKLKVPRTNTR